jgi:hypothetical protein
MSVNELKAFLSNKGALSAEIKKHKKKEQLISFAKEFLQQKIDCVLPVSTTKVKDANIIEEDETTLKPVLEGNLEKKKIKSGAFVPSNLDDIQVIADEFDPELANHNSQIVRKYPKIPSERKPVHIKDNSNDEDAAFRYGNKPKIKPPWH